MRSYAENDLVVFLNQYTEGMVLDEVHNAPNLLSYIQGIVDEHPKRRFILSVSSQFAMLKKVTQSLAGRTAVFELLPLSYSEILEHIGRKSLDDLLFEGFYPAIYAGRNIPRFLYPSYIKTYLDKDVRDLLQVKDMVMEAMKRRYNRGKESNLYFYRDSHQNEVDLILKNSSGLYGVEIKFAMTYHVDFEKALKQMDGWINEPILMQIHWKTIQVKSNC